jgi:hypothetical protein
VIPAESQLLAPKQVVLACSARGDRSDLTAATSRPRLLPAPPELVRPARIRAGY